MRVPPISRTWRSGCSRHHNHQRSPTNLHHRNSHPSSLSRSSQPRRLHFHNPWHPSRIVAKTRPRPIFRTLNKATRNRIAVNVLQLLRKLPIRKNIEVKVSMHPKGPCLLLQGNRYLQRLQHLRQNSFSRLTHQQMNMFRHDDIGIDVKVIFNPHRLQRTFKQLTHLRRSEIRPPLVTRESHHMQVTDS
jgi:hypothetical protein